MGNPKNNSMPLEQSQAPEAQVLGDFDPRVVQHRDPKTGRVIRSNPFKVIVERGRKYFEHPVGSGNLWFEDRTHAGRLEKGLVVPGAEHKLYVRPITEDEKLAREHAQVKQENERLLRELEEIKKEKEFSAMEKKAKAPAKAKSIEASN